MNLIYYMALDSMDITSTVQHQFPMSGVNMNLKPPKPAVNIKGAHVDWSDDGRNCGRKVGYNFQDVHL